jgi:hypothetical protein
MRQLVLILGLAAVGCGGSSGSGDDTGGGGADADYPSYNCATETRADTFSVGLEKMGAAGLFDFKMMTADPAPPARYNNTWVIEVDALTSGVAGAPMTGLDGSDFTVVPYMPDHQHGTSIKAEVTPATAAGQYQITPVNLYMPGLWQTTIQVNSNGMKDHAVFSFCISS